MLSIPGLGEISAASILSEYGDSYDYFKILSHVCKKLIRVIYSLEKYNQNFNPSLLK